MYQINKLRQKLANANKHSVEYKMSVDDAKALLAEIDGLLKPSIPDKPIITAKAKPSVNILDGGTF